MSHKNLDCKKLKRLKNEFAEGIKDLKEMNICRKCIFSGTKTCNDCILIDNSKKFCLYKERIVA